MQLSSKRQRRFDAVAAQLAHATTPDDAQAFLAKLSRIKFADKKATTQRLITSLLRAASFAARHRRLDVLNVLLASPALEKGRSVARHTHEQADAVLWETPLFGAIRGGDEAILRRVLTWRPRLVRQAVAGVNVVVERGGQSVCEEVRVYPLHAAVWRKESSVVVRTLCALGANVWQRDGLGLLAVEVQAARPRRGFAPFNAYGPMTDGDPEQIAQGTFYENGEVINDVEYGHRDDAFASGDPARAGELDEEYHGRTIADTDYDQDLTAREFLTRHMHKERMMALLLGTHPDSGSALASMAAARHELALIGDMLP